MQNSIKAILQKIYGGVSMKIKTDLTIVDNNAKYVCQRKIKVKPILKNVLKYYAEFPNDKRRHTDIEASCPICLAAGVRVKVDWRKD